MGIWRTEMGVDFSYKVPVLSWKINNSWEVQIQLQFILWSVLVIRVAIRTLHLLNDSKINDLLFISPKTVWWDSQKWSFKKFTLSRFFLLLKYAEREREREREYHILFFFNSLWVKSLEDFKFFHLSLPLWICDTLSRHLSEQF